MSDLTPVKLRRLSRIVRAERDITRATQTALLRLAETVGDQLAADGYHASILDNRAPEWREALAADIMPLIAQVYADGYAAESRTSALTAAVMPNGEPAPGDYGPADHLATQYLQTVHNRMTGVADDVFRRVAAALEEGRQATFTLADGTTVVGESIPDLAKRVQALLRDNTTWSGDAVRVARTEVIGANNAGAHAAAFGNAELLGASSTAVIKEWLNTSDHRTRPTHQDAGGQLVLGLDTPFQVGASTLQAPGDPSGPAGEVINCRCTALYHYPGDPGYDEKAAALGATPALPESAFDPASYALQPSSQDAFHAEYGQVAKQLKTDNPDFVEAREWYFGPGYIVLSKLMRQGEQALAALDFTPEQIEFQKQWVRRLLAPKFPTLPREQVFARGVRARGDFDPGVWQVGQEVVDPGFYSVTTSERVADRFARGVNVGDPGGVPWNLRVRVPEGTSYFPGSFDEQELVLMPGERLRVRHVDAENHMIYLDLVGD